MYNCVRVPAFYLHDDGTVVVVVVVVDVDATTDDDDDGGVAGKGKFHRHFRHRLVNRYFVESTAIIRIIPLLGKAGRDSCAKATSPKYIMYNRK